MYRLNEHGQAEQAGRRIRVTEGSFGRHHRQVGEAEGSGGAVEGFCLDRIAEGCGRAVGNDEAERPVGSDPGLALYPRDEVDLGAKARRGDAVGTAVGVCAL